LEEVNKRKRPPAPYSAITGYGTVNRTPLFCAQITSPINRTRNFIRPEIFVDYKDLDSFLHKDSQNTDVEEEASKKVVEALHKILRPILLRRVNSDVEKSLCLVP
jgi:hypothetical protein